MQTTIIERAVATGVAKVRRPLGKLFLLSVLGGAFIALGGTLSVLIGQGVPGIAAANPGIQRLLCAVTFPIGLFLIVMFGADLFTGNNALLIPGWRRGDLSAREVAVNWALVWIGNFAGCLLFTFFLVAVPGLFDVEPYHSAIIRVAESKTALTPLVTFFRGIGANWCVCLAVWLALGVDSAGAKALCIWIPVATFVALGYEHCIANMFFIPAGMFAGAQISAAAFATNLIVATFGNIIGGALFVGHLFNHLYKKR